MRIPSKLKVGGKTYSVKVPYEFKELANALGQTCHMVNEIRVTTVAENVPRKRENIEQTLIHEMLHCIDQVYNHQGMNEDTVSRISEGLYQVLKDNRMLQ